MTQFSVKVQKPYFCLILGPFFPKSREREFSQIWDLRRKLANHNTLHFRSFLAKSNDSILSKVQKPYFQVFWGLFGPLLPIFWKIRVFPKNRALSLFSLYGPLTSCKKSEKTNETILRKTVTDRQTDRQTDGRTTLNSQDLPRGCKKGLGSTYATYWSLTSCKISKKSNVPILSNIQESVFFSQK